MTEKEKKAKIIKDVIKPLIKSAGYKCSGNTFYSDRQRCYVIIYLQLSHYNNEKTGFEFRFNITVMVKSEVNDISEIKKSCGGLGFSERGLLPDYGYLHPYHTGWGYCIGGLRNHQKIVTDYEDAAARIGNDISQYILPRLENIQYGKDWAELQNEVAIEVEKTCEQKRIRLLSFFYYATPLACSESNKNHIIEELRRKNLTHEDILENMDMLAVVHKYVSNYSQDVEQFIKCALCDYREKE